MKRQVESTLTLTIHEPGQKDGGIISTPMFLMMEGGTYTHEGVQRSWGLSGGILVAYLPGYRAVTLSVEELIRAGLEATTPPVPGFFTTEERVS